MQEDKSSLQLRKKRATKAEILTVLRYAADLIQQHHRSLTSPTAWGQACEPCETDSYRVKLIRDMLEHTANIVGSNGARANE